MIRSAMGAIIDINTYILHSIHAYRQNILKSVIGCWLVNLKIKEEQ